MIQEAIITKLLPDNMAEVAVVRATACGKSCSSCESCIFQNELKVQAKNSISSIPGKKVLIETESSKIFGVILLVYLLPIITMLAAYIAAAAVNLSENLCIALAFVGFVLGILPMLIFHRRGKNNAKISYTIIKELT